MPNHDTIPLGQPTEALPGTERKLLELQRRYEDGLDLWHPEDHVPLLCDDGHQRRELFGFQDQERTR